MGRYKGRMSQHIKIKDEQVSPLRYGKLMKKSSSNIAAANIKIMNPIWDRISELPDDILLHILSLLTFREATRAKTLSTRWLCLDTTYNVVSLEFPFPLQQRKGNLYGYYQLGDETQFSSHVDRINQALDSYKGRDKVIKKFRVDIPCTQRKDQEEEEEEDGVSNKLFEFALFRKTESMDVRVIYSTKVAFLESTYLFPASSITKSNGFLKELSLTGVTLYDTHIRVLLSNLIVLERLLLESSNMKSLSCGLGLYINGPPTSKLKHLIVSNVSSKFVNISDLRNLVSLWCDGMEARAVIYLHNLLELLHVRVRCEGDFAHDGRRRKFPCFGYHTCEQLRRLEFFTNLREIRYNDYRDKERRLKHLEMKVVVDDEECDLHRLFSFTMACPCLRTLEIKLIWAIKPKYKKKKQKFMLDEERVNRVTKIDYLRTLKLSEFCGSATELEFVWCVINNGVVLDELILEASATNCGIIQREIANSFKHLIALAPTSFNLILRGIPLSNLM